MVILNTLAPVFLLIFLGTLLVRGGLLSGEVLKGLNKLTYWVALPSVIFHKLAMTTYEAGPAGRIFVVVMAGTFGGALLAWFLGRLLRISPHAMGTFLQATFRGNLAFIGLPVILYAFADSINGTSMTTAAVLAFAPTMVVYNIAAVLVLLRSANRKAEGMARKTVRQLITNPLILAAVAGILWAALGIPMPLALDRSFGALSSMALPLALICIGGTLVVVQIRGSLRNATIAALLKVTAVPLLGWITAVAMQLPPGETLVALILLACPTAAASFVLTQQLYGDEALASSAIVLSTLFSLPALAIVVWVFA